MSDSDLDDVVGNFVKSFPSAGQKTLAEGFRIQRRRIRESLLRVDPYGVELAGPNSLWHIVGAINLLDGDNSTWWV